VQQTAAQTPEIVVVTMQAVKFRWPRSLCAIGGTRPILTFFDSFGHIVAVMSSNLSKNCALTGN
jgi:hypothetical protein